MRTRLWIGGVLIVAFWPGISLHAQTTFTKSYVADTVTNAYSIAPMDDGGFVLAGKYQDTTFDKSISLVRVDSLGAQQWSRKYGPASAFSLPQIIALSGGNLLVICPTPADSIPTQELFLLCTDAGGDVLWTHTYDLMNPLGAANAVELPNGDLILACFAQRVFYLTRVDSQGVIIWSHGYQGGFKSSWTGGNLADVILTSDSAIVACGTIPTDGPDDANGFLVKTDLNGDLIWAKFIGGPSGDGFHRVVETLDGGYLAMGRYALSVSFPIAVRTDANGTVLWRKRLSQSTSDRCSLLARCPDGNYLIGGDLYDPPVYKGLLLKLSDAGDLIWSNAYGDGMLFNDVTLANGGMAVVGMHYGTIPFHSMTLLRGDTIGATDCEMMPYPLVVDDVLLTESDVVTVVNGLTPLGSWITTEPLGLTEMAQCLANDTQADEADAALAVFPNPCSTFATIHMDRTMRNAELTIHDQRGRLVKHMAGVSGASLRLETLGLLAGLYVVAVSQDGVRSMTKFAVTANE